VSDPPPRPERTQLARIRSGTSSLDICRESLNGRELVTLVIRCPDEQTRAIRFGPGSVALVIEALRRALEGLPAGETPQPRVEGKRVPGVPTGNKRTAP